MNLASPEFWFAVLQIIAIDIVLSGDNAVVIALACRNLPETQRRRGILWGVAGAVGLRVALTAFAASLLGYPYLKLIGGLLLLWIGIKLLLPPEDEGHDIRGAATLWGAIKTIIVADFVMSLDNVIAVAAAAKDSLILLLFGLAVSIPLIIWTSQLFLRLMERHPILITLGAGLLGYVAGGMLVSDLAIRDRMTSLLPAPDYIAGAIGAALVIVIGHYWARSREAAVNRKLQ